MHLNLIFSQCTVSPLAQYLIIHQTIRTEVRVKLFWPGCFFMLKLGSSYKYRHTCTSGVPEHRILTLGEAGLQLYKYNKTNNTDKWNWNLFESISSWHITHFLRRLFFGVCFWKHGALRFKSVTIAKTFKACEINKWIWHCQWQYSVGYCTYQNHWNLLSCVKCIVSLDESDLRLPMLMKYDLNLQAICHTCMRSRYVL